jgi:malate synthase
METATQIIILPQEQYSDIFTPDLVRFLTKLHAEFNPDRIKLLRSRTMRQIDCK